MVRLLHTADVHLSPEYPERQAALEELLSLAEEQDTDLVTIGGDLFDSAVDAEELRADLRQLFSDRPYPILTIPGNHDEEAFREDLFFGEDFQPAVTEPFEHVTIDEADVRITCLPYTQRPTDDLLVAFKEREPFDGTEILLLHCSLEAPFSDRVVGEEQEQRYFPVSKATLAEFDFDYYLAGHYHSPHRVELRNESTFVYPGTPASVTRSETGPRNVAILDTEEDQLSLHSIETFHYDHLEVEIVPGEEEGVLEEIEEWADTRAERNVEASITVTGHITMDEAAFNDALEDASRDIPVSNQTSLVDRVVTHPLYQSFEAKLEEREFEDEALEDEIRDRTLRVFSELVSGGRLS